MSGTRQAQAAHSRPGERQPRLAQVNAINWNAPLVLLLASTLPE